MQTIAFVYLLLEMCINTPRFCVYSIANSIAGTMFVQFVLMDLFPLHFIRWNLIEKQHGVLVHFILQTSHDCLLKLFIQINDMYQLLSVYSLLR